MYFSKQKIDYYATLEIEVSDHILNVSPSTVKKAFRTQALIYHPDKGNVDSDFMFKRINDASTILSDPEKKREYDDWYMSYYKRTKVTRAVIDKEKKRAERMEREQHEEANKEAEKLRKAEKKAAKAAAEEQRRKKAKEEERQRKEEERQRKEEEKRKEAEKLRKIAERKRREKLVLEKRQAEEKRKAEERLKQKQEEDRQRKEKERLETFRRSREAAERKEKEDVLKRKIKSPVKMSARRRKLLEEARLRRLEAEERLRAEATASDAAVSAENTPLKSPSEVMSKKEYLERLNQLKEKSIEKSNEHQSLADQCEHLTKKVQIIEKSAEEALAKAKKKYEDDMTRRDLSAMKANKFKKDSDKAFKILQKYLDEYDTLKKAYTIRYGPLDDEQQEENQHEAPKEPSPSTSTSTSEADTPKRQNPPNHATNDYTTASDKTTSSRSETLDDDKKSDTPSLSEAFSSLKFDAPASGTFEANEKSNIFGLNSHFKPFDGKSFTSHSKFSYTTFGRGTNKATNKPATPKSPSSTQQQQRTNFRSSFRISPQSTPLNYNFSFQKSTPLFETSNNTKSDHSSSSESSMNPGTDIETEDSSVRGESDTESKTKPNLFGFTTPSPAFNSITSTNGDSKVFSKQFADAANFANVTFGRGPRVIN